MRVLIYSVSLFESWLFHEYWLGWAAKSWEDAAAADAVEGR